MVKITITDAEGKDLLSAEAETIMPILVNGNNVQIGYYGETTEELVKQLKKHTPKLVKTTLDKVYSDFDKEMVKLKAISKVKSIMEENKNGRN